jgi:hypothetical protein
MKMVKKSTLLKRTIVRLLLFGIPFTLSYLVTRPAAAVPADHTFIVCAYPTERPGELRISLDPAACAQNTQLRAVNSIETNKTETISF